MVNTSEDDALDLNERVVAEIDEEGELEAGGLEVILHLGTMGVRQLLHGFDLDDDFVVADEVGDVFAFELGAFVVELEARLRDGGHAAAAKLDFETLLINGLQKACPLVLIDFK